MAVAETPAAGHWVSRGITFSLPFSGFHSPLLLLLLLLLLPLLLFGSSRGPTRTGLSFAPIFETINELFFCGRFLLNFHRLLPVQDGADNGILPASSSARLLSVVAGTNRAIVEEMFDILSTG